MSDIYQFDSNIFNDYWNENTEDYYTCRSGNNNVNQFFEGKSDEKKTI